MAPLLQELSSLELESLDVLVYPPESEQERSLDTLTITSGDLDVIALLTGTLSPRLENTDCCCCCCCTLFP